MEDLRTGTIYKISSQSEAYVGATIEDVMTRWRHHIYKLQKGTHYAGALQGYWNKFGLVGLTFTVLQNGIPKDQLTEREDFWRKKFCASWNSQDTDREILKYLHEVDLQMIADDITRGLPYRQVAEKHNVSLGTVSNVKKRYLAGVS